MVHHDEPAVCPLCLEALDITDLACQFCTCGYSMCLWCWHRIREDAAKQSIPARCPNCRTVYRKDRVKMETIDPDQLEDTRRKQKEERKKAVAAQPKQKRDLANVRVVQRNLVYAVGLAMEICHEETLMGPSYFGAFGKMVRQMSVNRGGPYGSSAAKNGPSGSVYITFKRPEDAKRCIEVVNGAMWGGKQVKACFGTTKYCNAFLKGIVCNNPECLYLHEIAEDTDSYTKEETKSSKFINLTHAASISRQPSQSNILASASGKLQGQPSADQLSLPSPQSQMLEPKDSCGMAESPSDMGQTPWIGSPPGSSWLAKAASMTPNAGFQPSPLPLSTPVPPSANGEEWPELGVTPSAASASATPEASPPAKVASPDGASKASLPSVSQTHQTPASKSTPGHMRHPSNPNSSIANGHHSRTSSASDQPSPQQQSPSSYQPEAKLHVQGHIRQQHVSPTQALLATSEGVTAPPGTQQLEQQPRVSVSQRQLTPPHPSQSLPQPDCQLQQQRSQEQPQHLRQLQHSQQQQQQSPHQQSPQLLQQLPQMSSLGNIQADPVVQLVSHRNSGRGPPPGFAGSVGASSAQPMPQAPHTDGVRRKGPPPGFATPLNQVRGRTSTPASSYSSAEHLCAAADQQGQSWQPQAQSQPHPWLSQTPEYHPSLSPLASYQANAFAMPSLSSGLHSLWSSQASNRSEQSAEHSLFSGGPHAPGFPQSQFRQQSRFQFAQELSPRAADQGSAQHQQVSRPPLAASHSMSQQDKQHALQPQQQHQRSPFRQDAAHSHEATHPFANQQAGGYDSFPSQSGNGAGQALLNQLQMPQSLSSDQQAQRDTGQNLADGWGLPQSFSNMPFFDPAVLGAADAMSQPTDAVDAGPAQSYSEGQRMPSEAVHGRAGDGNEPSELVAEESAGSVPNAEPAQKNGKRRRGGRGTKGGGVHRSPQPKGKGRGQNASNNTNSNMVTLQQQYNQARSQLAISGAHLAQAQQNFQNIRI